MSDKNKSLIIFDFDGTIADSLPVIYKTGGEIIKDYTDDNISPKEVEKLKESGIRKAIKKLNIPFYKFPIMLLKIQVGIYNHIDEVEPFPGIEKTIQDLKKDYRLAIFTNNRKKTVNKFLKQNDLDFFEFVKDNPLLRSKDKKLSKMSKNALAYVGDQAGDMKAAKETGVLAVGVDWGLDSKGRLERNGADFIAENPEDLNEILKQLV